MNEQIDDTEYAVRFPGARDIETVHSKEFGRRLVKNGPGRELLRRTVTQWEPVASTEKEARTMTLSEFLLERIKEEADLWAQAVDAGLVMTVNGQNMVAPTGFAERQVAQCAARRKVVQAVEWDHRVAATDIGRHILRLLAAPYAEHPDYRNEWAPSGDI